MDKKRSKSKLQSIRIMMKAEKVVKEGKRRWSKNR
jgi:hypothetical protein